MKNIFGPSWKTSLGAILVAAGYIVESLGEPTIAKILTGGGTTLIGLAARDNTVSSEEAKATPAVGKL